MNIPEGWRVERKDDALKTIIVTAPNGYSAVTTAVSRNPENVLRMLVQDLAAAPPAPAVQASEPVLLREQPSGDAWGDGYEEGYKAGLAEPDPPPERKPLSEEDIEAVMNPCDNSEFARQLRRQFIESFKRVYFKLHPERINGITAPRGQEGD